MPEPDITQSLRDQLARWTQDGLIDAEQRDRIAAAERARLVAAPRRRLPLVAEVLGYVGAMIAIVAGGVAIAQVWSRFPPGAQLAFAGVATAGLLAAGAVLRTRDDPGFARLRSVLWLFATAGAGSFAALLAGDFANLSGRSVALLAAAAWTALAVPLWWRSRMSLQHLAMFAGAATLAGTASSWFEHSISRWFIGIVVWLVAALWGIAVHRGYLTPSGAGWIAAGAGLLIGATLTMEEAAGQALAVATVAGLLAAGIALHRVLLIGIGAAGMLWIVPWTALRYLPGSVGAPLAVTVVGLVLLGIAIWLARTRQAAHQQGG